MFDKLNGLVNKAFKFVVVGVIGLGVIAVLLSPDKPKEVESAELELWQAYNSTGIYDRLTCKSGEIDNNWVILCRSLDGGNNGVYEVDILEHNQYRIHYVNGTAKTHVRRMGKQYSFNENSTVDLSKAIKELG